MIKNAEMHIKSNIASCMQNAKIHLMTAFLHGFNRCRNAKMQMQALTNACKCKFSLSYNSYHCIALPRRLSWYTQ